MLETVYVGDNILATDINPPLTTSGDGELTYVILFCPSETYFDIRSWRFWNISASFPSKLKVWLGPRFWARSCLFMIHTWKYWLRWLGKELWWIWWEIIWDISRPTRARLLAHGMHPRDIINSWYDRFFHKLVQYLHEREQLPHRWMTLPNLSRLGAKFRLVKNANNAIFDPFLDQICSKYIIQPFYMPF